MAVINPGRNFEGGDMGQSRSFSILHPDVRAFDIRKHKEGARIFILPSYKADANGNGIWYRVISVRDSFGIGEEKQRFVEPDNGPIAFFASRAKQLFPNFAEVQKVNRDGRQMKVYPVFGRIAKRVLFNVTMAENMAAVMVFDAPTWGVGDAIQKYHNTQLMDGSYPPLVNDPARACPIFLKMERDSKGQPWSVIINPTQLYALPPQLADSTNLYNLDVVCLVPSKEEMLEKLRQIIPAEILTPCMQGYEGFRSAGATVAMPGIAALPAANPMMAPAAAPIAAQPVTAPAVANLVQPAPVAQPVQAAPVAAPAAALAAQLVAQPVATSPAPAAAAPAPAAQSSVPSAFRAGPNAVAPTLVNPAQGVPVANGAAPTPPKSKEELAKWLSE